MPKKGHTNNPKGKPKGTKSAKTIQWEAIAQYLTEQGAEKAVKILMKLNDDAFMRNYLQILEYFKPKLARIDQDITSKGEKVNIPIIDWVKSDKDK